MNGTCGIIVGFSTRGFSKKPSVRKLWREKANMQINREPFSRSFGTNETQQLREGQLVGRMLLQRLATGATGVKQARYRQGPTRAARHSYAHAQYTLRIMVLGPASAYEFRRGFCTLVLFIIAGVLVQLCLRC